jgi:CRISPR-associated protein Csd2
MKPVRCIAFRHESEYGNARADQLFGRVSASLRPELAEEKRPPRQAGDYDIRVAAEALPSGVTAEEWVAGAAAAV